MLLGGGIAVGTLISPNENKTTTSNNLTATALANVLIEITSTCDISTNNSQIMQDNSIIIHDINNSTIDIKAIQNIQSKLLATCTQKNDIQEELASKFAAELDKMVTQETSGFTSANNTTETINNIKKDLVANININSVTTCLSKIASDQSLYRQKIEIYNIDSSIIGIDLEQLIVTKLVSECLQSNTTISKLNDDLTSKINELNDQSQKGFDLNAAIQSFTDMINGIVSSFTGSIFFIIILCIGLFFLIGCRFPLTKPFATIIGICSESKQEKEKDNQQTYIIPVDYRELQKKNN